MLLFLARGCADRFATKSEGCRADVTPTERVIASGLHVAKKTTRRVGALGRRAGFDEMGDQRGCQGGRRAVVADQPATMFRAFFIP